MIKGLKKRLSVMLVASMLITSCSFNVSAEEMHDYVMNQAQEQTMEEAAEEKAEETTAAEVATEETSEAATGETAENTTGETQEEEKGFFEKLVDAVEGFFNPENNSNENNESGSLTTLVGDDNNILTEDIEGIKVTVEYEDGAFEEGVIPKLVLATVSEEKWVQVNNAVEELKQQEIKEENDENNNEDTKGEKTVGYTLDVTIVDAANNNTEVQPITPVQVKFETIHIGAEADEVNVYHIKELDTESTNEETEELPDGELGGFNEETETYIDETPYEAESLEADIQSEEVADVATNSEAVIEVVDENEDNEDDNVTTFKSEVTVTTEGFSFYVVQFSFSGEGGKTITAPNGSSSILLRDYKEDLGITRTIRGAIVNAKSRGKVKVTNGIWSLWNDPDETCTIELLSGYDSGMADVYVWDEGHFLYTTYQITITRVASKVILNQENLETALSEGGDYVLGCDVAYTNTDLSTVKAVSIDLKGYNLGSKDSAISIGSSGSLTLVSDNGPKDTEDRVVNTVYSNINFSGSNASLTIDNINMIGKIGATGTTLTGNNIVITNSIYHDIDNYGAMSITSSVSDGGVTNNNANGNATIQDVELNSKSATTVIVNEGALTITSSVCDGTIENMGTCTINSGSYNDILNTSGEITIEAGTYNGTIENRGTFTANAGTFKKAISNEKILNIKGGTVFEEEITNVAESTTNISGGSFAKRIIDKGTITLTGGRYAKNAFQSDQKVFILKNRIPETHYVREYFTSKEEYYEILPSNWGLVERENASDTKRNIVFQKYDDFVNALANCYPGDVFTVKKPVIFYTSLDIALSEDAPEGTKNSPDVVIDLGGTKNTLTLAGDSYITNSATTEIKNGIIENTVETANVIKNNESLFLTSLNMVDKKNGTAYFINNTGENLTIEDTVINANNAVAVLNSGSLYVGDGNTGNGKTRISSNLEAITNFTPDSKCNINSDSTIIATTSSAYYAIENNLGEVYINGGTITGSTSGIFSSGKLDINAGHVEGIDVGIITSNDLVVTNGTISGSIGISGSGTIKIKGGSVSGKTGISSDGGTITIDGGKVSGTSSGIYGGGTVIVQGSAAVIEGDTYAINSGGTVNVYNGKISSVLYGIQSTGTINIHGGTVTGDEYGVIVGYMSTVYSGTLYGRYGLVNNGTTDIKGGNVNRIVNYGKLTVSGGTIQSEGTFDDVSTIENHATLDITGGQIVFNGVRQSDITKKYEVAVTNEGAILNKGSSNVTISGGETIGYNDEAIIGNINSVKICGGEIYGKIEVYSSDGKAKLQITGGTISPVKMSPTRKIDTDSTYSIRTPSAVIDARRVALSISNGIEENGATTEPIINGFIVPGDRKNFIKGGAFASQKYDSYSVTNNNIGMSTDPQGRTNLRRIVMDPGRKDVLTYDENGTITSYDNGTWVAKGYGSYAGSDGYYHVVKGDAVVIDGSRVTPIELNESGISSLKAGTDIRVIRNVDGSFNNGVYSTGSISTINLGWGGKSGKKLNLNGYYIDCSNFYITGCDVSDSVVDFSTGNTPSNQYYHGGGIIGGISAGNSQTAMPIRDTDNNCYRFFEYDYLSGVGTSTRTIKVNEVDTQQTGAQFQVAVMFKNHNGDCSVTENKSTSNLYYGFSECSAETYNKAYEWINNSDEKQIIIHTRVEWTESGNTLANIFDYEGLAKAYASNQKGTSKLKAMTTRYFYDGVYVPSGVCKQTLSIQDTATSYYKTINTATKQF